MTVEGVCVPSIVEHKTSTAPAAASPASTGPGAGNRAIVARPAAGVSPLITVGHRGTIAVIKVNARIVNVVKESGTNKVSLTVPLGGVATGTRAVGSGVSGASSAHTAIKNADAPPGPSSGVLLTVPPVCAGGGTHIKVVDAGVDSAGKAEVGTLEDDLCNLVATVDNAGDNAGDAVGTGVDSPELHRGLSTLVSISGAVASEALGAPPLSVTVGRGSTVLTSGIPPARGGENINF